MMEWFSSLDIGAWPFLVAILVGLGGCLVGIVNIIAAAWRSARVSEIQAALKQDMLNRGMSAEEIERIIKAAPPGQKSEQKKE